jgi:hypothetical protein
MNGDRGIALGGSVSISVPNDVDPCHCIWPVPACRSSKEMGTGKGGNRLWLDQSSACVAYQCRKNFFSRMPKVARSPMPCNRLSSTRSLRVAFPFAHPRHLVYPHPPTLACNIPDRAIFFSPPLQRYPSWLRCSTAQCHNKHP